MISKAYTVGKKTSLTNTNDSGKPVCPHAEEINPISITLHRKPN